MVAVSTLVAESAEEAERLALPNGLLFVRMRKGERPGRIPTLAEAEAYPWSPQELEWVRERNSHQAIGDVAHVTRRIADLASDTGADEVIVAPQGPNVDSKLQTLRAIAGQGA